MDEQRRPRAVDTRIPGLGLAPGWRARPWGGNLADLHRHADDFARRVGFTYSVIEVPGEEVIGCVYIYPGRGDDAMVEVSSWVRADWADLDRPLYEAVSTWLAADWPFRRLRYTPRPQ